MAAMIIPVVHSQDDSPDLNGESRLHVAVHVQANVLEPNAACRKANKWLLMNAGNLLRAEQPELILDERLLWRFQVSLTLPTLDNPGHGESYVLDMFYVDALTGEAANSSTFLQNLQAKADALAIN